MAKKKREIRGWNDPEGEEYYIWDTIARIDGAPVANMYHFVADAKDLIIIPERKRPCITLEDGVKITETDLRFATPQIILPDHKSGDWRSFGDKVWIWRMSPAYTIESWLEEVKRGGEIVCWTTQKWVVSWVKRKFTPYVLVAHELPIKTPVGVIFAAFRPKLVYYPYNDSSNPKHLEQVDKYGTMMAQRKIRVANTMVWTNHEKTEFRPLATKIIHF